MDRLVRFGAGSGSAKHVLHQHTAGADARRLIHSTLATCNTNKDKDESSDLLLHLHHHNSHHNLHKPKQISSSSPEQATNQMLADLAKVEEFAAMDEASTRNSPATTTSTTTTSSSLMPGGNGSDNGSARDISTTTNMTQHRYIRLTRGTDELVASDTTQGHSLAQKFLADKFLEHSRRRRHARGLTNRVFLSITIVASLWLWSVSTAKDKAQADKLAVRAHNRPDKRGLTEDRRSDA